MMPNADAIALGKQIKAVRKAMKMTQEQLALKSNVSVKYIANIENGKQNAVCKKSSNSLRTSSKDCILPPPKIFFLYFRKDYFRLQGCQFLSIQLTIKAILKV